MEHRQLPSPPVIASSFPPSSRLMANQTHDLPVPQHHSPPPTAQQFQRKSPTQTYELTASSIYYAKPVSPLRRFLTPCAASSPPPPTSYILRDVSLTARPGEILAIVGPSGAGKSTLIDILAARTAPTAGRLLLNSSSLHPTSFRRLSAHLPQHDHPLPHLTVAETFHITASLLLPPAESAAAATSLLSSLRLSHLSHDRLPGSLSGGELRRVSLGLALLRDPAVLLLDEPTSGLDSASALLVIHTLRRAASSRRLPAVILSIHQPSSQLLSSIDSFLFLSGGAVLHRGDLNSLASFLSSAGFPLRSHLNPIELAFEVLPSLPTPNTPHPPPDTPATPQAEPLTIHYPSTRPREVAILNRRYWKVIYRSKQLLLTNTLEAILVGFLLGTIYISVGYDEQGMEKRLGFFAFTLTFLLSSTTETLPIFVSERPILLREASAGVYRLSSHLIATTLVFIPYLLAIAVLYTCSVYFLVGLCASLGAFASFVMIVWAVILAANSFVLFVSAVTPDYIAGTSVVTAALAGFFLFSGYFLRRERMPQYWMFMHYMSPYRYALDAMLENEYGCESGRCFGWEGMMGRVGRECRVRGKDVLEERGLREGVKWIGLQVLLGFFVFYRVLYWAVLVTKAGRCRR